MGIISNKTMSNNLIPQSAAAAGSVAQLTWTLQSAPEGFDAAVSDGYQVLASLGWKSFGEDAEEWDGGLGACVEGLNADGEQVEGEHAVCHWIAANNANEVSAIYNNLIPGAVWQGGALTGVGAPIEGSVNNGLGVGLGAAAEEVVDEVVEDAADAAGDAVEDAFQGDDDWGDEVDEAVDEAADAAVAAAAEVIPPLPAATFLWWQPKVAKSYEGLRRYGAGDKVQAFSLVAADGTLTATKQGDA